MEQPFATWRTANRQRYRKVKSQQPGRDPPHWSFPVDVRQTENVALARRFRSSVLQPKAGALLEPKRPVSRKERVARTAGAPLKRPPLRVAATGDTPNPKPLFRQRSD